MGPNGEIKKVSAAAEQAKSISSDASRSVTVAATPAAAEQPVQEPWEAEPLEAEAGRLRP